MYRINPIFVELHKIKYVSNTNTSLPLHSSIKKGIDDDLKQSLLQTK